jgi:hypothetical protein
VRGPRGLRVAVRERTRPLPANHLPLLLGTYPDWAWSGPVVTVAGIRPTSRALATDG